MHTTAITNGRQKQAHARPHKPRRYTASKTAATYKIDLHTHSQASPDGVLRAEDYERMLASRRLDYIAVTDHDTAEFALQLREKLGDRIIVGEEISTQQGEVIGLYISKTIPAGMTVAETAKAIRAQGGLVYIPHPFETVRKGVTPAVLDELSKAVDIIEVHNGRAIFQNRSAQAADWAANHHMPGAAASDTHGQLGWGSTYTNVSAAPTAQTLAALLGTASYSVGWPRALGVLYPKLNRLRKRWDHA